MQDTSFWILVSLLEGEAHGYAITRRTAELSDGAFKLGAGSLYSALDRLSDEGLISKGRQEIENGRARQYFRLLKKGKDAISEEIEQRANVVRMAKGRLKLVGGVS